MLLIHPFQISLPFPSLPTFPTLPIFHSVHSKYSILKRKLYLSITHNIGKNNRGDKEGSSPSYVSQQPECLELCLRKDEELTESLRIRTKVRAGTGDVIVGGLLQAT